MLAVVDVPEDAGRLPVLLDIRGQSTDEDVVWFGDVRVCRLD